ncbi:MAG: type II toxin-antitoxin system RelE/ParE family toxin [Planctomycetales bacterium]|nr:type II toxin-antitoxin system RelE/ParE family toxin [Planctomycetales bacterium]
MATVAWTEKARDDLREIHDFIARDSPAAAEAFVERLQDATDRLARFPRSGRKVPEFPRLGYREILYGAYRILYRAEGATVLVAAVVHGKRLLDAPPGSA